MVILKLYVTDVKEYKKYWSKNSLNRFAGPYQLRNTYVNITVTSITDWGSPCSTDWGIFCYCYNTEI
jgi:hypothetical protein